MNTSKSLKAIFVALIALLPLSSKAFDIVDIYEGETKVIWAMGENIPVNTTYLISWDWVSDNNNIQITSKTASYCYIKGINGGTTAKLTWKSSGYVSDYSRVEETSVTFYINIKRKIKVSSISISPSSPVFLQPNEEVQLNANVYPSDAYKKDVKWKSSNPEIVSVSDSGLLTAQAYGTSTITCSATDGSGVTATCEVTVADKVPVSAITLSDTQLSLGIDGGNYIYATIAPSNTTCTDYKWESSNPDVATVYKKGTRMDDGTYRNYISAKALGTTTITCTADDGSNVQASCTVNVYRHGDNSRFVGKSIEGIYISYYVEDAASGTCVVYIAGTDETGWVDNGITGTVTIPSEVDGFKVVQIGRTRTSGIQQAIGKGLTQVILPASVERIESGAFYGCGITSIALDHVKYLGNQVFDGCTSLTKVTGINNLEYIGSSSFARTPFYDKLPNGPIYLGKVLYQYKGGALYPTELTIPERIVSITPNAFYHPSGCGLVSVNIPKSMTNLSGQPFYDCDALKEIVVAAGNETYDSRNDCNAIIETKSNTLLAGCEGTVIPETVKAIGELAFKTNPHPIVIPNSVDSIANGAFGRFGGLSSNNRSIQIGNGLRKLGVDAFPDNADSVKVSPDNPYFDSRDNCNAIIETGTNKLVYASEIATIPFSIRAIGTHAFGWTNGLTSIKIHDGIERIEDDAFHSYFLQNVTIGRGVKEIGKDAFRYCSNLKSVHSLMVVPFAIDESVFGNTKATLYVPRGTMINYMTTEGWANFEKIVEIDDDALMDGERFTEETIEGIELTYEVKDCINKTCELVESPTTIEGKVTIPDKPKGYTVTSIADNAFYGYNTDRKITEVIIPQGVETIGKWAFAWNRTIKAITIPNSVKSIGLYAFYYNKIESVDIPNSVDSIGECAFRDNSLESIVIGTGLRKLVGNPFYYNSKLKSISVATDNPYFDSRDNCNAIIEKSNNTLIVGSLETEIPSTVKSIGDYAFYSISGYIRIIPDNVENVGKSAFGGEHGLRSLTIGRNVKHINSEAFYSCYNLLGIHVLNSTPIEIEESVFKCYTNPDSIYNNAMLFVPIGTKAKYMATAVWNKFKKIEEIEDDAIHAGMVFESNTPEDVTLTYMITDATAKTCQLFASPSDISGELTIPPTPEGYTLTEIERSTFSGRGMSAIMIPETIQTIQPYAFASCRELKSVYSLIKEPFDVDSLAFSIYNSEDKKYYFTNATLYVPKGTKAKYQAAGGWKYFINIVEIDTDIFDPTIVNIQNLTSDIEKEIPVYNLSGQRLEKPQKGVNIIDGKKVLVK